MARNAAKVRSFGIAHIRVAKSRSAMSIAGSAGVAVAGTAKIIGHRKDVPMFLVFLLVLVFALYMLCKQMSDNDWW